MGKFIAILLIGLTLGGCSSGSQIGQHRDVILADIDYVDQQDQTRGFGEGRSAAMYESLGDFLADKVSLGGMLTPELYDLPEDVSSREFAAFTIVTERTDEERAAGARAKASVWYFWDDDDKLIATLREDWD
ncbi:hypothetical protein OAU50_06230 [Planctomycetota bacterium]|nr:hypothetical protein [Planctomycetota bacterium]